MITNEIRNVVNGAFSHLIGQTLAINMLKRTLATALANVPPMLGETLLFVGPPSTGKTTLARIMADVLNWPFVEVDGKTVRTREHVFSLVEGACNAGDRPFVAQGIEQRSGLPVYVVPPCIMYIDEAQKISEDLQGALLTALEPKTRRVVINHPEGRRAMLVHQLCLILSTTNPEELSDAFRSRCNEIRLTSYSQAEVAQMLLQAEPFIGEEAAMLIAGLSRSVPRQGLMLTEDAIKESRWSGDKNLATCARRVAKERGIVDGHGMKEIDRRYMRVLKEGGAKTGQGGKPMGLNTIIGTLYDVEKAAVEESEAWLLRKGFLSIVSGGRLLTWNGQQYLEALTEAEKEKEVKHKERRK